MWKGMKMVEIKIDIAGKVCLFCLLIVKKQLAKLAEENLLNVNMIIHLQRPIPFPTQ
jgi:TusA-related sulfurtransferase